MMNQQVHDKYVLWLNNVKDSNIVEELKSMSEDTEKIKEVFSTDLSFGTGGIRELMGAGTNRINIYTIAKVTQGVSEWIKRNNKDKKSVAIAYDSRNHSKEFAEITASVFTANNIQVYIFQDIMPTPCLSYAVRKLACDAGVVITASHNSAEYNGYKVYNSAGCQITNEDAKATVREINEIDIFSDINYLDINKAKENGLLSYIKESVLTSYLHETSQFSCMNSGLNIDKNISIVYTPLHGTGLIPVTSILNLNGYMNIHVVKEQAQPDSNFTSCPKPNPEDPSSLELALKHAKEINADLVLATDPDCDRIGIAVRSHQEKSYFIPSGNEIGILLFDYICSRLTEMNKMPKHPKVYKTIVTSEMIRKIGYKYGIETIDVLNGFKYIGEQICCLEQNNELDSFIFGVEENFGYLNSVCVRDKDAVNASLLLCEMYAYYHSKGIHLENRLEELYKEFGYVVNDLISVTLSGIQGNKKLKKLMESFRNDINKIEEYSIVNKIDYLQGIDALPKSNIVRYVLEDNSEIIIRPSGTEPKLKIYISSSGVTQDDANKKCSYLKDVLNRIIQET